MASECRCSQLSTYRLAGHVDGCPNSPLLKGWLYMQLARIAGLIDQEADYSSQYERNCLAEHFASVDWDRPVEEILITVARLCLTCPISGASMYSACAVITHDWPDWLYTRVTGRNRQRAGHE